MAKISIAEVKRRLAVGVTFTGEFVGTNAVRAAPGMKILRRRVISNKSVMTCELLEGPKMGQAIDLNWKNVTADERDGSIYLTMNDIDPPEEFLKITFDLPKELA